MHGVVDIETLAVTPNALILSVAATRFDPLGDGYEEIDLKIEMTSQPGRLVEKSTVDWWQGRDKKAAWDDIMDCPNKESLKDALIKLNVFLRPCSRVWACDPDFDLVILNDAMKSFDMRPSWGYSAGRSIRTVEDLFFGGNQRCPGGLFYEKEIKHNALQDCILEMKVVKAVYFILSNCGVTAEGPSSILDVFEDRITDLGK